MKGANVTGQKLIIFKLIFWPWLILNFNQPSLKKFNVNIVLTS